MSINSLASLLNKHMAAATSIISPRAPSLVKSPWKSFHVFISAEPAAVNRDAFSIRAWWESLKTFTLVQAYISFFRFLFMFLGYAPLILFCTYTLYFALLYCHLLANPRDLISGIFEVIGLGPAYGRFVLREMLDQLRIEFKRAILG